jgi:hypothetical protein
MRDAGATVPVLTSAGQKPPASTQVVGGTAPPPPHSPPPVLPARFLPRRFLRVMELFSGTGSWRSETNCLVRISYFREFSVKNFVFLDFFEV